MLTFNKLSFVMLILLICWLNSTWVPDLLKKCLTIEADPFVATNFIFFLSKRLTHWIQILSFDNNCCSAKFSKNEKKKSLRVIFKKKVVNLWSCRSQWPWVTSWRKKSRLLYHYPLVLSLTFWGLLDFDPLCPLLGYSVVCFPACNSTLMWEC